MKKLFIPRAFPQRFNVFFGDELTEDQKKEAAIKEVKDTAITAAKSAISANLPALLKTELGSTEAKALITTLAEGIVKEMKLKDPVDNEEKTFTEIFTEMQKQHDAVVTAFEAFKESKKGQEQIKSILQQVTEQKAAIKKAWQSGLEEDAVLIETKALTNRASVDGNAHALDIAGIGQLATRKVSLYDLFTKFPVGKNNNGTVRYYDWDEATTVRAAAAIAEGALYPESTAKWKTYTESLKKVGDSIPMTEEFMYDDEMFAAELEAFLRTNVDLEVDRQMYEADGTGNQIKGIKVQIPDYTPVPSGIQDPSIYDLIPKVIEAIVVAGGSKYSPNVSLMNRAMINQYKLKKDANGNYLTPPFVSRDGKEIDGTLVVEANIMDSNEIIVGDSRFARIYEEPGIFIDRGRIDDDFLRDINRLKVRRRMLFIIRNADRGGWRRVADVQAAIATLGTEPIPEA